MGLIRVMINFMRIVLMMIVLYRILIKCLILVNRNNSKGIINRININNVNYHQIFIIIMKQDIIKIGHKQHKIILLIKTPL